MSVRFTSSSALRAFFEVRSRGTFPATVVIASTCSSSGEARAARNATASSGDGSVSKMTFIAISAESPQQALLPAGDIHFPEDFVLASLGDDIAPDGAISGIRRYAQAIDHAHPAGDAAVDLRVHVVVRGNERQRRVEQNGHRGGIWQGDAFLPGLHFVGGGSGA